MPPRWAPRAYRSCGASLRRRPRIRKERGTQAGAQRRDPAPASRAWRTWVALTLSGAAACFVLVGDGLVLEGDEVFFAMPVNSSGWNAAGGTAPGRPGPHHPARPPAPSLLPWRA